MKALVLGVGLQGRAVVHDLERSSLISRIVAADVDVEAARTFVNRIEEQKTSVVELDATRVTDLHALFVKVHPDICVSMLPPMFGHVVAKACLVHRVPYVSTNYTRSLVELADEARDKGVPLLPEVGLDPGIDLVLGRLALDELEEPTRFVSYGGGVPLGRAREESPLDYKITWTWRGVLEAYRRPGRYLADGVVHDVPGDAMFDEVHGHTIDVPGLGVMEAYPNGDALPYADLYGIEGSVETLGRFGLRWPGHSAFWRTIAHLGLLSDQPTTVGDVAVAPLDLLDAHLAPQLQFGPDEQDVVVIRVEATGAIDGMRSTATVRYDLIDRRDLTTGLFAMNRTVGYTASIAAQMILDGRLGGVGLLTPTRDVPGEELVIELEARGMEVTRTLLREPS